MEYCADEKTTILYLFQVTRIYYAKGAKDETKRFQI